MSSRGKYCAAALVIVVSGLIWYWQATMGRAFRVAFLDVGQGDSALVQFANGEKMLIDCGPDQSVLGQLGRQLNFFDRTVEYLVVTHFDADHYAGCVEVLRRYHVRKVITNGDSKPNNPLWQAWDAAVHAEKSEVITAKRGDVLHVGASTSTFLWPTTSSTLRPADSTTNNRSLVFTLEYDRTRFVFTGDIEAPVEKELMRLACDQSNSSCQELRSDVLKAPHHGSDTSSTEEFIQAIQPSKVVISVGKKNTFGHPSPRVLRRYEWGKIAILRTDQLGAILLP